MTDEGPSTDEAANRSRDGADERTLGPAPEEELDDLPSTGLLSFYDRLRARIEGTLASRAGGLGEGVATALLLVPDVFMLLLRLSLDRRVPKGERALVASALAYFVLPLDLFPEAVVGGMGFVEDLVLAVAVLSHAFGPRLDAVAAEHWSGPGRLRQVMADVSQAAHALLGADLYDRVVALLRRRGVEIERPSD